MRVDRGIPVTGIPLIDRQHTEYMRLVDHFLAMCGEDTVAEADIQRELHALLRYVIEHFDAEEHLMQNSNYSRLREHAEKHAEFRSFAQSFLSLPSGEWDTSRLQEITRWLLTWFYDQVQEDDCALARHLDAEKARKEK